MIVLGYGTAFLNIFVTLNLLSIKFYNYRKSINEVHIVLEVIDLIFLGIVNVLVFEYILNPGRGPILSK